MAKRVYNFYPKKDLNMGNKYILKEYISEGTFGYVWSAFNIDTEEIIALKIPKDQEKGDNALSEGQKLKGLYHENVIQIFHMGRVEGVFVIEMEYFKGNTLADELTDNGFKNPKTIKDILKIYSKILEGVKFLHDKSIQHGDIKPQNILINSEQVKITDFGTSKFIENVFVKTVDAGGTWAYLAPEIAGSNMRFIISDIYSLGVLLYQFLTGRTPHETPIQVINNQPYPKPREINDNISHDLEFIILKALERNPENRYQSIDELIGSIKKLSICEEQETVTCKIVSKVNFDGDWLQQVINFYKEKMFNEAELCLKFEVENGNKSQDILYHLAFINYSQKRLYDSLAKLEEINMNLVEDIRLEAFWNNVLFLKARIYTDLKKYEESTQIYETLSQKNPANINYKYRLAIAYGLINNPDLAIEKLEEINQETPGLLYIIKKLGHAYDIKKEYSKARGYFKYAIKIDQNDEFIRNRLKVFEKYLN